MEEWKRRDFSFFIFFTYGLEVLILVCSPLVGNTLGLPPSEEPTRMVTSLTTKWKLHCWGGGSSSVPKYWMLVSYVVLSVFEILRPEGPCMQSQQTKKLQILLLTTGGVSHCGLAIILHIVKDIVIVFSEAFSRDPSIHPWHHTGKKILAKRNNPPPFYTCVVV
jgi:hypothetical protein